MKIQVIGDEVFVKGVKVATLESPKGFSGIMDEFRSWLRDARYRRY